MSKWCYICDQEVESKVITRDETLTFKGATVTIQNAQVSCCSICDYELYDEELDNAVMKKAINLWEEQTGMQFK